MKTIRMALTKGRLEEKTVEMLERLGYDCTSVREKGRKLIMPIGDGSIEIVLAKAADVVTYVETGVCDMGVVGKDTIMEKGGTFYEVADLGFGKCRFALAALKGKDVYHGYKTRTIASKYMNVAKAFFESKNMDINLVKIEGSVELAPVLGLADAIVDIVETGTTLRENGLEVKEDICNISARLIVNIASMKLRKKEIEDLMNKIEKDVKSRGIGGKIMAYEIPERLKKLQSYQPVTEVYQVRLDANESFLDLPENIRKDVLEAIRQVEFHRYPDPEARELCQCFGEFFHIPSTLITAGNGSDELISLIIQSFLIPGESMVTVSPDFSMYEFYAQAAGVKVQVLEKQDMQLCAEDLIQKVRECSAGLLIFSNPCNPTALKLEREDVLKVVREIDALVVVDEAYMDFSEGSVLNEVENYTNLIVLKTCSKAFGMAAIRLGFAAANRDITGVLKAVKSPYNVNSLTQAAGCAVLKHQDYLRECTEKIREATAELYTGLKKIEEKKERIRKIYPTSTNFIYIEIEGAKSLFEALKKEGISVRFMNGYLRICAGNHKENKAVLQAVEKIL